MNQSGTGKFCLAFVLLFCALFVHKNVAAQYLVDCSGNTPGAYTTINSVLPVIGNGAMVQVIGTCTENVTLSSLSNIWMGAPWGQSMNLQGNLSINGVQGLFLYGFNVSNTNVSNSNVDGIDIQNDSNVELEDCTSNNNAGLGLDVGGSSSVSVQASGSFSNNATGGVSVSGHSDLQFSEWTGSVQINNNTGYGLHAERSSVYGFGPISFNNNKAAAPASSLGAIFNDGFGIMFVGAAQGVFYPLWGPITIQGNQNGGISMLENSEISLCCGSQGAGGNVYPINIQSNGPIGISVGFGSQLTLDDEVQIGNHADAGVDVFGNSQVDMVGTNQISNNGFNPSYAARAGMRVDGNSEAYIRNGEITQNGGPGILAIVNSSLDFAGVTLAGNNGGPVLCDVSSWMVSDQAGGNGGTNTGALTPCRIPNTIGNRNRPAPSFRVPDVSRYRADEAKYRKMMTVLF